MIPARILPDLQCSIICDGIRQEANQNLILLGVMDKIVSPQFPIPINQLLVVNRWTAGKGEFTQAIRILATDQTTVLHKVEARFALADPVLSVTSVLGVGGFQFPQPGPYWVEVMVDDVMKLRYALPVFHVQLPPPGQKPGEAQPPAPTAPAAG
jgi:hypothetical protein